MRACSIASITSLGFLLFTGIVWKTMGPPKDPVCNGVRLSEWIKDANRDGRNNPISIDDLRKNAPQTIDFLAFSIEKNRPRQTMGIGVWLPNYVRKYLPESYLLGKERGDFSQCLYAVEQLSGIGPDAKSAKSVMLSMLNHQSKSLRDAAARGLNCLGPDSWDDVNKLISHGDLSQRRAIIFTLVSRLGPPAPNPTAKEKARIVAIFLDACADPNPKIRRLGVGGLMNCRAYFNYHFDDSNLLSPAGPAIAKCITHGTGVEKVSAASAISYFPESIDLALNALIEMAADESEYFSRPALETLNAYKINPRSLPIKPNKLE